MYKIVCEHKLGIVDPALTKFMGERYTSVRPGRMRKSYWSTEEVQEKVVGGGAGRQEGGEQSVLSLGSHFFHQSI